jgi:hypothetical protein
MDRSKIVAVVTGIISLVLAIAYLLVVQILDFRGEMLPAPILETISQQLSIENLVMSLETIPIRVLANS